MGITGRTLAEAQDEKGCHPFSVQILEETMTQQAGQEDKNKKQGVSMGALKQTQEYVPVLTINRVCMGREEVPAQ